MREFNKGQFLPYQDLAPRKSFPILTIALILLNVMIFLWSIFGDYKEIISTYGFIPASFSLLTLVTSMFLHGGFDHIFGNMLYLWIFGDNVEDKFGKFLFIIFYFLSGFAASALHLITNLNSTIPAIGASGAISGVLGAYLVFFPKAGIRFISRLGTGVMPAYYMIGFWFIMQLFFGFATLLGPRGSGIAFWSHIGGFVFGYLFAKIYKKFFK
ncbi:MAG: rhomboid family intramembrane serine protease [Candidatus Aenigmatarchaeota archaeon]